MARDIRGIVRHLMAPMLMTLSATAICAQHTPLRSAADAIRLALGDKLGPAVEITIEPSSSVPDASQFTSATPDPAAWLGRSMRFTLLSGTGPATSVFAIVHVVGDYAVATHALSRDQVLTADDVKTVHGEWRDVPLRRLPTVDALIGARTLRPIDTGMTIQAPFVIVHRTIEPGDKVTAVATAGAVEVTATLVAADGGSVGDVIRMVNPDTRKYLRGRVLRAGYVEVIK